MSIWLGSSRLDGGTERKTVDNQNPSSIIKKSYNWIGTLQEAIDQDVRASHPDWSIYITDDVPTGEGYYTKSEVDSLIANSKRCRNIGDIFYTKRSEKSLNGAVECNGATYNTTDYVGHGSIGELLANGKLPYIPLADYTAALATKGWCDEVGWDHGTEFRVPTMLPKRYVIKSQEPTAENGYNWYRLYNDGWVVQGGAIAGLTTWTDKTITFLIPFADNKYDFNQSPIMNTSTGAGAWAVGVTQRTPTTLTTKFYSNNGLYPTWRAEGQSAIASEVSERAMFQLFDSATDEAAMVAGMLIAQLGELNSHRVIKFQAPTAENNNLWYRQYADGWVEQGGFFDYVTPTKDWSTVTITLPKIMLDETYTLLTQAGRNDNSTSGINNQSFVINRTTSSFKVEVYGDGNSQYLWWQVSGMMKLPIKYYGWTVPTNTRAPDPVDDITTVYTKSATPYIGSKLFDENGLPFSYGGIEQEIDRVLSDIEIYNNATGLAFVRDITKDYEA